MPSGWFEMMNTSSTQGTLSSTETSSDWYKDAVIYQLHVRSFCDAEGDGVGDFKGLTSRLGYLEDLGVTALWLLPFYPSPLRDDGYDIADYTSIHPSYGTLADFRKFLHAAHAKGLRVITELVVNHTSDRHAWFQRARRAKPGSPWRDFYVWSDTPERYEQARIIFQDFEHSNWAWDPVAKAYYWHRFYSHQPDLNFDNPRVHTALFKVLDHWFNMGVDGMRLDAVPYLYEREGTNCENLPETYAFLKKLRAHVDRHHPGRMLLAEANQWPEDAVAYFGEGDSCHMAFHFPLMPRMYMALETESRYPVQDVIEQTPPIPPTCQWALFLRNHDELTLEMVTDEERDFMYSAYAQNPRARINLGIRRRLAPLLDNDPDKIRLMNLLLFCMPGTPIIYYGDEIGMGDNFHLGDRDGVRTPMQWSPDRNAGFSRCNPQSLFLPVIIDPEYHFQAVNVETQERHRSSLLWWMRRLIGLRRAYPILGRGEIRFVDSDNGAVLAFFRRSGEENLLVAANLSRHPQQAELRFQDVNAGRMIECFGGNHFSDVTNGRLTLTFGRYGIYLLRLESSERADARSIPKFQRPLHAVLKEKNLRASLEKALVKFLPAQPWFKRPASECLAVNIIDWIGFSDRVFEPALLLLRVELRNGTNEWCNLPLVERVQSGEEKNGSVPGDVVALTSSGAEMLHCRCADDHPSFSRLVYDLFRRSSAFSTNQGRVAIEHGRSFHRLLQADTPPTGRLLRGRQTNISLIYADRALARIYRRTAPGRHPEVELNRRLAETCSFPNVPDFGGSLTYEGFGGHSVTFALLQKYIPNQGLAWDAFFAAAGRFLEYAAAAEAAAPPPPPMHASLQTLTIPQAVSECMGGMELEQAALLGRRIAEMHLALTRAVEEEGREPELFSRLYARSVFQSMRNLLSQEKRRLDGSIPLLDPESAGLAMRLLAAEPTLLGMFRMVTKLKGTPYKIFIHGDLHLGQILNTGEDFVIHDFEGDPMRSLSVRLFKRSPLRDVASLMRSLHYAAWNSLHLPGIPATDRQRLATWADWWYAASSVSLLRGYLKTPGLTRLCPEPEDVDLLLNAFCLERCLVELGSSRPQRPILTYTSLRGALLHAGEM